MKKYYANQLIQTISHCVHYVHSIKLDIIALLQMNKLIIDNVASIFDKYTAACFPINCNYNFSRNKSKRNETFVWCLTDLHEKPDDASLRLFLE